MAKGYDFEQEVENILKAGFETQRNYQASAEEEGKRREIDIVASKDIPPFGNVYFLIECKTMKIGVNHVSDFKDKMEDIKKGCDPYSQGMPVMVSPQGWSAPAEDEANKSGIKLMTLEQLQSAEIPIPKNIEIHIAKVQLANEMAIKTNMIIPTTDWGDLKILKSTPDYSIKALGTLDIYMELGKGKKEMIPVFGKYIGPVDEDLMRVWIQKVDAYVESQKTKGNKIFIAVIGFFTKTVSDDDKKVITKLKGATSNAVTVIDENFKLYGNLNAKKVFTP